MSHKEGRPAKTPVVKAVKPGAGTKHPVSCRLSGKPPRKPSVKRKPE